MLSQGQSVGPYVLIRKLGGGAFGEAWLAKHDDQWAVKIPTDPDYVKQRRRERRLHAKVSAFMAQLDQSAQSMGRGFALPIEN